MPIERELNERFSHAPVVESDGSSAARACRTRASASAVRSVASATAGVFPVATLTASANDSRRGLVAEGACAATGRGAAASQAKTATIQGLVFRNAMEI